SRYGDTPAGMVESVMEYLRIAVGENFHNIVISIKASNVVVMVATVRLLVREMEKEGMNFPLHLGVTEAGDGEDGRIKSAAGIGTLLAEGLGDTIRVSLSEPPENEIPVAIALRDYITAREGHAPVVAPDSTLSSADSPLRDKAVPADGLGKTPWPLVIGYDLALPDSAVSIDASSDPAVAIRLTGSPIILTSRHINPVGEMSAWMERYYQKGGTSPVIISLNYDDADKDIIRLKAAADFGALLLNGYANAISIHADALSADEVNLLALAILQACRLRFSKTEYIACPGCGRTLFRLQDTLAEVKRATSHLKGLKIGVMGCIVNGPGEMADADYGYVGAGPGRVSIYKGKTLIHKNLPTADALPALIDLIKSNGDWKEPS
ncbi:MAG: flavodoxin-dependent (E)-4-hydroxy-3-methylbut-2-enyl-diphosphate synthase, partial [Muribaculaceae bacterium]|nr:flavodoxin-dependent (E)-4-hydroxy-3-methylbut-2-enyl-diphosphate synthase [Muribaculaceae bacterium]